MPSFLRGSEIACHGANVNSLFLIYLLEALCECSMLPWRCLHARFTPLLYGPAGRGIQSGVFLPHTVSLICSRTILPSSSRSTSTANVTGTTGVGGGERGGISFGAVFWA